MFPKEKCHILNPTSSRPPSYNGHFHLSLLKMGTSLQRPPVFYDHFSTSTTAIPPQQPSSTTDNPLLPLTLYCGQNPLRRSPLVLQPPVYNGRLFTTATPLQRQPLYKAYLSKTATPLLRPLALYYYHLSTTAPLLPRPPL